MFEKPRFIGGSMCLIFQTQSSGLQEFNKHTWPLPVGRSKVTVRFVFRDAANGQEIFRTDREGNFQATLSGGIATKQQQMAAVKNGVVDSLIKEIRRNR